MHGKIDDAEMARTFNCGIGMAVVVKARRTLVPLLISCAQRRKVAQIGHIRSRNAGEHQTLIAWAIKQDSSTGAPSRPILPKTPRRIWTLH